MDLVTRVRAGRAGDDRPAAVVGDTGGVVAIGMLGCREQQPVVTLRRAQAMKMDRLIVVQRLEVLALRRLREARVDEGIVACPGKRGELGPADLVTQLFAGGHVHHAQDAPVAAAVLHAVEQFRTVRRRHPVRQRGGAVIGPLVGIDQQARLALQAVTDVERRLVLQSRIVREEIAPAALVWRGVAFEVEQLADPLLEPCTARQFGQVTIRERILPLHPVGHFGRVAHVLFQPAVGVGDLFAEDGLGDIAAARLWILGCGHVLSSSREGNGSKEGSGKDGEAHDISGKTKRRPQSLRLQPPLEFRLINGRLARTLMRPRIRPRSSPGPNPGPWRPRHDRRVR